MNRVKLSDLARRMLESIDVSELVATLLPVRRVGHRLVGRCPFHDDHHPSFSLDPESGLFVCFGCGAKGDVFDLAGHIWSIRGFPRQVAAVARWARFPWAAGSRGPRPSMSGEPICAPTPTPGARRAQRSVDRAVVVALWESCDAVAADSEVASYLQTRGLDPTEIAARDLARALPERLVLPNWASFQRVPWNRSGHRLVALLCDARGQIASLTARRIVSPDDGAPKALFPPGPRAGLLLASNAGCWLLRAPHDYLPAEIWIGEGLTDHLALACDFILDDSSAPGVLSLVGPGSWSKVAAERVPDGVVVVVAVDADEAGDRYLTEIVNSFRGRNVQIDRWRPRPGQQRGES